MKDTIFFKQAELIIRILPLIEKEDVFALKGGTAINFFYQNMPRISVDIDLTYIPVNDRDTALKDIHSRLIIISEEIKRKIPGTDIIFKKIHNKEQISGLIVNRGGITVKIESNLVLRGTVYLPEIRSLCKKAQDIFEVSLKSRVLSAPDLYAGKICAALDRQHPRDLFDIYLLLKSDGLNFETRKAFIVYLICHPRPMLEILNPRSKSITDVYEKEFKGMIAEDIQIEILENSLNDLVKKLREDLTGKERRFILSVKESRPMWDLLELEGIQNLPAVKWKLKNILKMDPIKHHESVARLKDYLNI